MPKQNRKVKTAIKVFRAAADELERGTGLTPREALVSQLDAHKISGSERDKYLDTLEVELRAQREDCMIDSYGDRVRRTEDEEDICALRTAADWIEQEGEFCCLEVRDEPPFETYEDCAPLAYEGEN